MNSQGRIENSVKNSSLGLLSQVVHIVAGLIVRTVFIHYLNAEYLGVNGLFTNILTVLSLAELGFGSAITYNLYKPISTNDKVQIAKYMNLYHDAYRVIGCVVAVLGLCFIPFLENIIHGQSNIEQLTLIYGLFLLNTVFSYLFSYKRSIFNADQKQRVLSFINLIYLLVKSVLQIIVLVRFRSFIVYLSVQIFCTLLENITASVYADRCYPFLKLYSKERLSEQERKNIFRDIKAMIIYKIGGVALNGTDNIIISAFDGLISVGVLSNYSMIVGSIQSLITKITGGLTGSIGNYIAKESKDNCEKLLFNVTFLHYILYGMCFVGCMAVINPFITMWAGDKYVLGFWTVFVFCLNIYIEGMMTPVWTFRTTMGLFTHGRFLPLVTAGINLIVSILLARRMGLIGVLLGTTVSRFLAGIWPAQYIIFHYGLNKDAGRYYAKWIINLFIVCLDIWLISLLSKYLGLSGVAAIIVYGIFAILFFSVSTILVYMRSTELLYTATMLKNFFRSIRKRTVHPS